MTHKTSKDLLSFDRWKAFYKNQADGGQYSILFKQYVDLYYQDTLRQLNEAKPVSNCIYLEIGCGPFFLGQLLASKCQCVIGVDTSPSVLGVARRMLVEKHIANYLLIRADIRHMPIKNSSVELIYGGGVIEHFPDTLQAVRELFRVLSPGGVSFNSVPYANLGACTYRQLWGNIPNIPIIKQLAEWVHIKLLKGRHLVFGYELSFTRRQLHDIHSKAGFRDIEINKFQVALCFYHFHKWLRPYLEKLANSSPLFWPMLKVVAKKQASNN